MPTTKTRTKWKFYGDGATFVMACGIERDDAGNSMSMEWVNQEKYEEIVGEEP